MNPDTKEAGSINPITGRTRTGGVYDTANKNAVISEPIQNPVPMNSISPTAPNLPTPTTPEVQAGYLSGVQADVERAKNNLTTNLANDKKVIDEKISTTEKEQKEILKNIDENTKPFRADFEEQERQRLKVYENFDANQRIVNELESLLTQGNNLIQMAQNRSVSGSVLEKSLSSTMNTVLARSGILEAALSARRGQMNDAFVMIDRSIDAMNADRNDRLAYYDTLLNLNNNKLITLNKESRDIVKEERTLAERELVQAEEIVSHIKSLMVNPETAQLMADAGITLNDDIDTINTKMSIQKQKNFEADYIRQSLDNGIAQGLLSSTDVARIEALTDPKEKIQELRAVQAATTAYERNLDTQIREAQLQQIYASMRPKSTSGGGLDNPDHVFSIGELESLNALGYNLPLGSTVQDAIDAGVIPGTGTGQPSDFAMMVIDNPSLMKDLTATERGNVLREIASAGGQFQTAAQKSALQMQEAALASVEDLLGNDDTGFFAQLKKDSQRRSGTGIRGLTYYLPGSGGRQFNVKLDTLKAQMELPNLEFLAGLGRMSQEQFKTLQRATSNLESRELSNAEMRRQLNTVRDTLKASIEEAKKTGSSSLPADDQGFAEYQQLIGAGL